MRYFSFRESQGGFKGYQGVSWVPGGLRVVSVPEGLREVSGWPMRNARGRRGIPRVSETFQEASGAFIGS